MQHVLDLADRVANAPSYSGSELGGAPIRAREDPVGSGSLDNRAILVNPKYRDLIVAALRAYAGGPS